MMNFVHPASIRPLRSELMRSTALTPTQHKSFGLKKVVGVAAGFIIPFAAPAIATALSTSKILADLVGSYAPSVAQFFGSRAGSTAVGALLGAGAGAVVAPKGRRWESAALGALGGGIGGYANTDADPNAAFFGESGDTILSGGGGVDTILGSGGGGTDPLQTAAVTNAAGLVTAPSFGAGGAQTGLEDIAPPTTFDVARQATFAGDPAGYTPGFVDRGLDTSGGGTFGGGGGSGGAGKTRSLFDKVLDNKAAVGGLSKLGSQLFANAMVGDTPNLAPSPEQQEAARLAAQAQANERRLLGVKEGYATAAHQQALNMNPADRARRAYADSLSTMARARDAGLRNLPPGVRRSEELRWGLRVPGVAQRAYETAYGSAADQRQRLTASAAGLLPTGSGSASRAAANQVAADKRYTDALGRLGKEQEAAAGIVSPALESLGALSEEEIKKLKETGAKNGSGVETA